MCSKFSVDLAKQEVRLEMSQSLLEPQCFCQAAVLAMNSVKSKRLPFPTAEVVNCPFNTAVLKFSSHFTKQNRNSLSCMFKHGTTVKYTMFSVTCKTRAVEVLSVV